MCDLWAVSGRGTRCRQPRSWDRAGRQVPRPVSSPADGVSGRRRRQAEITGDLHRASRMAGPLTAALLCAVLLAAADRVESTKLPLTDEAAQGRSALLGSLTEAEPTRFRSSQSAAAGAAVDSAGSLGGLENRISAGTAAVPGEFPWIAALVLRGQDFVFCSATVIDPMWLLTAAHCLRKYEPNEVDVLVRKHFRNADPDQVRFTVTEIELHPDNIPFSYQNDVALVRVSQSLVPAAAVIALPTASCTVSDPASCLVGGTGVVAGWGLVQGDTFQLPEVLQKAEVPIIDNRNCARRFARLQPPFQIYDSMLCAGDEFGDADTCQGDSGGPLVVSAGGSYTLEGVVSFGYGCGRPGYYGVYQRIASFTPWIASELSA